MGLTGTTEGLREDGEGSWESIPPEDITGYLAYLGSRDDQDSVETVVGGKGYSIGDIASCIEARNSDGLYFMRMYSRLVRREATGETGLHNAPTTALPMEHLKKILVHVATTIRESILAAGIR